MLQYPVNNIHVQLSGSKPNPAYTNDLMATVDKHITVARLDRMAAAVAARAAVKAANVATRAKRAYKWSAIYRPDPSSPAKVAKHKRHVARKKRNARAAVAAVVAAATNAQAAAAPSMCVAWRWPVRKIKLPQRYKPKMDYTLDRDDSRATGETSDINDTGDTNDTGETNDTSDSSESSSDDSDDSDDNDDASTVPSEACRTESALPKCQTVLPGQTCPDLHPSLVRHDETSDKVDKVDQVDKVDKVDQVDQLNGV